MSPKILIVEQDDRLARFMQVNLLADGYEVLRAAEGGEAYAIAGREDPNLVILDLLLPGLDGWWVMKQFKGSPKLKPIPILIITSLADPDQKMRARRMGAVEYLIKPVGAGDLVTHVRKILNKMDDTAGQKRK